MFHSYGTVYTLNIVFGAWPENYHPEAVETGGIWLSVLPRKKMERPYLVSWTLDYNRLSKITSNYRLLLLRQKVQLC